jgi:hypothetical protein
MDSYRGMDRKALDRAYNNVAAVPDVADKMADFARRSAAIQENAGVKKDLTYGKGARQRIDWILSPRIGAPTLAFVHGGYWQSLSMEQFALVAAGPLAHGFNVALIEYTLAPDARIGAMVDEIGRAIDFLAAHFEEWGADPARLCLAAKNCAAEASSEATSFLPCSWPHRRSQPSCAGMSRKTQSLALTFFVTCRANLCRRILTHGRGALMTTYRFVWRDNKGNAPKSAQIECLTDQQAIDIAAHQTGDYETIEVWDGGRPVCRCGNSDKTGRADGRPAVRDSLASIA